MDRQQTDLHNSIARCLCPAAIKIGESCVPQDECLGRATCKNNSCSCEDHGSTPSDDMTRCRREYQTNHAHNIPLPLYRHAIWWIIKERKDSGKRITELPDSLYSIIIHLVLMGRVYCTAIIPFSFHIRQKTHIINT